MRPPCQRLGDVRHESEPLGPCQNKITHLRPGIDQLLQVRHQIRAMLYLVDHGPVRETGEESPRVHQRRLALIRFLEGDVGATGGQCPGQGRLSRLSRSRDRQDWKAPGETERGVGGVSRNHGHEFTNCRFRLQSVSRLDRLRGPARRVVSPVCRCLAYHPPLGWRSLTTIRVRPSVSSGRGAQRPSLGPRSCRRAVWTCPGAAPADRCPG